MNCICCASEAVTEVALGGCFLDGSMHGFDPTIGPGLFDLGEPVLDAILAAAHVKPVYHVM